LDSSGLYYYNARYYDPSIGRFISPDTVVPSPASPQSLNRYSYCLNNPLKYIDPSGTTVQIGDGGLESWIEFVQSNPDIALAMGRSDQMYYWGLNNTAISFSIDFNVFNNGVEFIVPGSFTTFSSGIHTGSLSSGNRLIGFGEKDITLSQDIEIKLQSNGWTYEQILAAVFKNPLFEPGIGESAVITSFSENPSKTNSIIVASVFGISLINPRFSPDQDSVIKLAQEAIKIKGGLTADEAKILQQWAKEYDLDTAGPEIHGSRGGMSSWRYHYHFGTKEHFWELP
jgi:RHS repeat-associated protein